MSNDSVKRWMAPSIMRYRLQSEIKSEFENVTEAFVRPIEVIIATDHDHKVAEVESKLATARKMIAKLRQQRDWWCGIASRYGYTGPTGDDVEIEKIEKGDET